MTIHLLADVEQIASAYLRSRTEVTDLVADRVWTEIPNLPTFPLVKLTRVGGGPAGAPAHLDRAIVQIEAYGGTKYEARRLAATCAAVLDSHEVAGTDLHGGYVTGSEPGSLRYLPDEETRTSKENARPRYLLEVVLLVHPSAA